MIFVALLAFLSFLVATVCMYCIVNMVQDHNTLESRVEDLEASPQSPAALPAPKAICGCGHGKAFHDKEGLCHWEGSIPGTAVLDFSGMLIKPARKDYEYGDEYQDAVNSYHAHLKQWAQTKTPREVLAGPCGCQGYDGPSVEYLPTVVG